MRVYTLIWRTIDEVDGVFASMETAREVAVSSDRRALVFRASHKGTLEILVGTTVLGEISTHEVLR